MDDYLSADSPSKPRFMIKGLTVIPYILCIIYFLYASGKYASAENNGDYMSIFYVLHGPIHEVGHAVFSSTFWPEWLHIFAGSLFQCLAPIAAGIQFIYIHEYPAVAVALGWLGFAVLDMAIYMRDAQVRELTLVAPFVTIEDASGHDWYNLFSMSGLLPQCYKIADATAAFGYLCVTVAIIWILVMIIRGIIWQLQHREKQ